MANRNTGTQTPILPQLPEHDKLKAVHEQSQWLGEFLDWLQNVERITLCSIDDEHYYPEHRSIERWLADYFEIDLGRLESEKRALLDYVRAIQEAK